MYVSKLVQIEGIGLYSPPSQNHKLKGTKSICKGTYKEGAILASKEMNVSDFTLEIVVNLIMKVLLQKTCTDPS